MNNDAFELIGKLMQDETTIQEIVFKKKGFRVRFTQDKFLFHFKFDKLGIESFLELYDSYQK